MVLFSKLKEILIGNQDVKKQEKGNILKTIIEPYPFEGDRKHLFDLSDRQYDTLYERVEELHDLFLEKVDELEQIFYETESKTKRLRALKSAYKAFDKCYQKAAPYWFEDVYFMDLMEVKIDDPWLTCKEEEAENVPYNFYSIFCIMWLIKKYEESE